MINKLLIYSMVLLGVLLTQCTPSNQEETAQAENDPATSAPSAESSEYNVTISQNPSAGLYLPEGFQAEVFADSLGYGRHLAVRDNGDVFIMQRRLKKDETQAGIIALRDADKDGKAETVAYYKDFLGTGIQIYNDYLYFSTDSSIYRVPLPEEDLLPSEEPELIVKDFIFNPQHAAKGFTFDNEGNLYVNVGAPSNACQAEDRKKGSPGQDPCPLLEKFGGVWRYKADMPNQFHPTDGYRYATGLRNGLAIDWNNAVNKLYLVQHGRDQLNQLHDDLYDKTQGAELPAEEFFLVEDGDNLGWPFCYYDPEQKKKVLSPEYGGDGKEVGRCADMKDPLIGFPAHYAPNDLLFYEGEQFPEFYKNGAFIAFHGSWNRGNDQKGFQVVFVPFDGENPSGDWFIFADGFAGAEKIASPRDAKARPTGLAMGSDGAIYVTDSVNGKIWRITYKPETT